VNRAWHEQHKMPSGATLKERIEWHVEHAKECGCRPIPQGLLAKQGVREQGQRSGLEIRGQAIGNRE
jgi:hypothetical protein